MNQLQISKITSLLNADEQNANLSLQILRGFEFQLDAVKILFPLYLKLQEKYEKQSSWHRTIYGQIGIQKSRASELLTLLFNQSDKNARQFIIDQYLNEDVLELPRLEWETLPQWIYQLKTIKTLNFKNGILKSVDDSINNFTALEILNLQYQPLEHISDALIQLKNLRELHLRSGFMLSDDLMDLDDLDIIIDAAY